MLSARPLSTGEITEAADAPIWDSDESAKIVPEVSFAVFKATAWNSSRGITGTIAMSVTAEAGPDKGLSAGAESLVTGDNGSTAAVSVGLGVGDFSLVPVWTTSAGFQPRPREDWPRPGSILICLAT